MLRAHAADPARPTADELAEVSLHIRDILMEAIANAPVVSNFMAQVATGMVAASASLNAAYPDILKEAFTRRAIISLQTSVMATSRHPASVAAMTETSAHALSAIPLDQVALPAAQYGINEPLMVATPSHPRRVLATAAQPDLTPADPMSAVSAATQFVDDLFARGRVDLGEMETRKSVVRLGGRLKTHKLVREKGALTLRRILFDCGLCQK